MMSNSKSSPLKEYRIKIDEIDLQLISLLAQRMKIVKKVGEFKMRLSIPPLDAVRWQQVIDSRKKMAIEFELDSDLVENFFQLIHKQALKIEESV